MKWEALSESVIIEKLPELPIPLANLSASIISEKVYVAGGEYMGETTNHFFSLDVSSNNTSDYKWTKLPSFPGLSRAFSVLQSQSNGKEHGLFLFSGRSYNKNEIILFILKR